MVGFFYSSYGSIHGGWMWPMNYPPSSLSIMAPDHGLRPFQSTSDTYRSSFFLVSFAATSIHVSSFSFSLDFPHFSSFQSSHFFSLFFFVRWYAFRCWNFSSSIRGVLGIKMRRYIYIYGIKIPLSQQEVSCVSSSLNINGLTIDS